MKEFRSSARLCLKNGERLLADAEHLFDWNRYPSAFALAKLAQEEFAKCFILKLASRGELKWTKAVHASLKHHVSKQLLSLILDYLNPDTEEFLFMLKNNTLHLMPKKVADAMNIYLGEILAKWESRYWSDPLEYGDEARGIWKGGEDRLKQGAFYIEIAKDGRAINFPGRFRKKIAYQEIEKSKRYLGVLSGGRKDSRYKEISKIFRLMTDQLPS